MGKDQDFLEAARNGNVTLIEKILSQKAKRSGPLASLRRGPGINVQDNGGYSALHYAALNGHTHIVRLLLLHEASPNILDSRGSSPLHLAAWAGHQEIVKMLLTHPYKPANPDMQTMENDTPLHCAAQHGHTGALTTLLAHGANPNIYNIRNETPLDLAAQYGRLQAVQMLIRAHPELLEPYLTENYYSSKNASIFPHSALHLASRNGHNNVVEILLTAGVNVNLLTPSGTALHEAALCGKDVVVRTLLEAGCDLNAKDSDGRTALDVLRDFPPHVTKGIISVINSFKLKCDREDNTGNQYSDVYPHCQLSQRDRQISNNITSVSPSVSMRSFDKSVTSSSEIAHDRYPDFLENMSASKMQKPPPKKPPRRNLSISPTHIQNSFVNSDMISLTTDLDQGEVKEKSKNNLQYQTPQDCVGTTMCSGNEKSTKSEKIPLLTNSACSIDSLQHPGRKPTPAPRKLQNHNLSENSVFKSYNPNRKLKRNRENNFAKGHFRLTINNDIQHNSTPCPIQTSGEAVEVNNVKKSESQCLNTESNVSPQVQICEISLCDSNGSISSEVSYSDRSMSTDCVEEYLDEEPFAGLFKGSSLNLNYQNLKNQGHYYIDTVHKSQVLTNDLQISSISTHSVVSREEVVNNISKPRIYKEDKTDTDEERDTEQTTRGVELNKNLCLESTKQETVNVEAAHPCGNMKCPIVKRGKDAWRNISEIVKTFRDNISNSDYDLNSSKYSHPHPSQRNFYDDRTKLVNLLHQNGLGYLEQLLIANGYDSVRFMNGLLDENDLSLMKISEEDGEKLRQFLKILPYAKFDRLDIESSLDDWLKSIYLMEYEDNFKKHLYNTFKSVCGVWEIELQTVLEINKIGHRKRILYSVAHVCQPTGLYRKSEDNLQISKSTLRHVKKNRPAPKPPLNIEIRAPSELLIGLPSNLRMKWPHSANLLISNPLKYDVYYLGSTIVKELRGTESTRKSIQKLKRNDRSQYPPKLNKKSNDSACGSLVRLSISYRGVEFIDATTNGTICEHEIRNINCACQDADDMRHFAYITIDGDLDAHYCHVFNVDNMHLAMEIILTLAESFEVAYQMALKKYTSESKSN